MRPAWIDLLESTLYLDRWARALPGRGWECHYDDVHMCHIAVATDGQRIYHASGYARKQAQRELLETIGVRKEGGK